MRRPLVLEPRGCGGIIQVDRVEEKRESGFPPATLSKPLESITFYDFGLIQSKIIVI
jgi:hypothetical protein